METAADIWRRPGSRGSAQEIATGPDKPPCGGTTYHPKTTNKAAAEAGSVETSSKRTLAQESSTGRNPLNLELRGKRALVTGSSVGLGEAIARKLAAEDVAVVVHGRDVGRVDRVVREIIEAGGRAVKSLGDLTSDDDTARIAEEAEHLLGGIEHSRKQRWRLGREAAVGGDACVRLGIVV